MWGVKYGLILLVFFHPIFIPYYLAPLVTAFHIQPLSGLGPSSGLSPGFTWGYSNSTPIGVA